MSTFHSLTVSKITSLTPNSVAVSFTIPENLMDTFSFKAGQYITIKHTVSGKEVRRAYSISSSPEEGDITVGIKKVADGTFSVYANESLKEGDVLEVMPPEGRFVFTPGSSAQHIAAFAAGSGITPIMSIAKTVLDSHPESTFVLAYGNQNISETMFHKELLVLKTKYAERFFIQFVYSRAHEDDGLFGHIENSTVNLIVKNKFKDRSFDGFYLCGPEAMIHLVKNTLLASEVSEELIHFELFTTSETEEEEVSENLEGSTQLEVTLDDEVHTLAMDRKKLVLDAVLDKDLDAPYSCQGGVCSTCIARVTEGKAEMVKNQILTDSEIEDGFILTCQAHPLTPTLKIDYDDV